MENLEEIFRVIRITDDNVSFFSKIEQNRSEFTKSKIRTSLNQQFESVVPDVYPTPFS